MYFYYKFDISYDTGYTFTEAIENRDMIFIAVPTPHEKEYDGSCITSHLIPKDFNYETLTKVVNECQQYQPNTPVIIISTVLPGTIRRLFSNYKDKIVYNPYLIGMGSVKEDLINPDILIIGTHDGKRTQVTSELEKLYEQMHRLLQ